MRTYLWYETPSAAFPNSSQRSPIRSSLHLPAYRRSSPAASDPGQDVSAKFSGDSSGPNGHLRRRPAVLYRISNPLHDQVAAAAPQGLYQQNRPLTGTQPHQYFTALEQAYHAGASRVRGAFTSQTQKRAQRTSKTMRENVYTGI